MNLVEAIKSGRRFRRADWTYWWDPVEDVHVAPGGLTWAEVLATDWEVEESVPDLHEALLVSRPLAVRAFFGVHEDGGLSRFLAELGFLESRI